MPGLADAAAALCRESKVKKSPYLFAFPWGGAPASCKLGLRVKIRDGWFLPEREFKTATEVKMISAVLMMAEVGMAEGIHALKRAKIVGDRRLRSSMESPLPAKNFVRLLKRPSFRREALPQTPS